MTEQKLFEALVQQELAALASKEEVKAIVEEAKDSGVDKDAIKLIKKAAKLHANVKFEEMQAENEALIAKYEELTGN